MIVRDARQTEVVYRGTAVVTFTTWKFILNSGGWRTATTKRRMNEASREFGLGFTVFQHNWDWFVEVYPREKPIMFYDGMELFRVEGKQPVKEA